MCISQYAGCAFRKYTAGADVAFAECALGYRTESADVVFTECALWYASYDHRHAWCAFWYSIVISTAVVHFWYFIFRSTLALFGVLVFGNPGVIFGVLFLAPVWGVYISSLLSRLCTYTGVYGCVRVHTDNTGTSAVATWGSRSFPSLSGPACQLEAQ